MADTSDPVVMAELVLSAAAGAVRKFADELHFPPLARLREHDARNGSSLVESVIALYECDGSAAEAAKKLHVHINTLRYRLRRASEIAELDSTHLPQRLALQLLVYATRDDS